MVSLVEPPLNVLHDFFIVHICSLLLARACGARLREIVVWEKCASRISPTQQSPFLRGAAATLAHPLREAARGHHAPRSSLVPQSHPCISKPPRSPILFERLPEATMRSAPSHPTISPASLIPQSLFLRGAAATLAHPLREAARGHHAPRSSLVPQSHPCISKPPRSPILFERLCCVEKMRSAHLFHTTQPLFLEIGRAHV